MRQAKRQLAGSGEALPSGSIGEVKFTSESFAGLGVNPNIFGAATTLTPGIWFVILCGSFQGQAPTDMFVRLADNANTPITADSYGLETIVDVGNGGGGACIKSFFTLRVTSTTTYKVQLYSTQAAGALNMAQFEAIRIA